MRTELPTLAKVIATFLVISPVLFILGASFLEDTALSISETGSSAINPYSTKDLMDYAYLFLVAGSGVIILLNFREGLLLAVLVLIAFPIATAATNRLYIVNFVTAVLLLVCYERALVRKWDEKRGLGRRSRKNPHYRLRP